MPAQPGFAGTPQPTAGLKGIQICFSVVILTRKAMLYAQPFKHIPYRRQASRLQVFITLADAFHRLLMVELLGFEKIGDDFIQRLGRSLTIPLCVLFDLGNPRVGTLS